MRNPGFTVMAALTLALGIGISAAVFSVVNGVLLQPLRFHEPDRIVTLATKSPTRKSATPRVTGGDFVDLREGSQAFSAISYYIGGEMGVQMRNSAEFTGVYFVNSDFFRVFEFSAERGHFFNDSENGAAVVSTAFAMRHFGDSSRALGERVSVENKNYQIAAVMNGPRFPDKAEIWLPAEFVPQNLNRTAFNYSAAARLRPGVEIEQAQTGLNLLASNMEAAHPKENKGRVFAITPLRERLVGPVRNTLYLLLGAVLLVLFISCANVSNLLLARASGRTKEMTIRTALGASRGRLIVGLIVESLLLALIGGAFGMLFAWGGTRVLARMAPASLPRVEDIRVDPTVLLFGIGLSLASALIFGLAPAWRSSRVELGGRGVLGARSAHNFRGALVVAEIAVAVVLATGAGLLFRSMMALSAADLGYRPEKMLVMYAHVPAKTLDEHVRTGEMFVDRMLPQLAVLPGVSSVGAVMGLPGGSYSSNGSFAVIGKHQFVPGAVLPEAGFRLSSPNYFSTMHIPLIRGRDFGPRDRYTQPFVAIVSQALVKQVFGTEDPIGKQILCGFDSSTPMTVVGVVGDVRSDSPGTPPGPELYMPLEQHPYRANELQVIVRTSMDPGALTPGVRDAVARINPEIAMKFTTLETMVADSVAAPRFRTFLIGTFAALALLLAMAGVYGVMNYLVSSRTSELGLRMALGAASGDVLRLVLKRAWLLAGLGLVLGMVLSLATGKLLASMLFGLTATDPSTYAMVLACVAAIATLAAFGPAWRASKIDPMVALREE